MNDILNKRRTGILLHITSLPGTGVQGDLGREAYHFVKFLHDSGVSVWQVLPLGMTHADGSPYQCLSAHAGNPALINVDWLVEQGWLQCADDCAECAGNFRTKCLTTKAYYGFLECAEQRDKAGFASFCREKAFWLDDLALFLALRAEFNQQCWNQWPEHFKERDAKALQEARRRLKTQIECIKFEQYVFFRQWLELKAYANRHGVYLFGDIPIFVSYDSADVWAHRDVLTALDAKTGKRVWSVQNGDPKLGMTNTNAPLVVKDKVLTGISGGEFGVRGFLAAYDINTGELAWKGYSIGPDKDMLIDAKKTTTWKDGKVTPVGPDSSLSTWQGDQWKIGGGTTWGWTSYDPKLNLIYYGSGNPSTWNPVQRPGDNKWSMSLWARDADTGVVKWVYQMTPHDEWDFDGINETVLVDQEVKGKMHKTIVHFDRNGFGYTLDRETGELLVAEKFDKSVNWATHVDMNTGRPQVVPEYSTQQNGEDVNSKGICPAALGAKNQQPVSYSPQTGLFYISGNHLCMDYEPFEVSYTAGQPYVGATLTMMPAGADVLTGKPDNTTNLGQFTAFDAKTGKIAWSNKEQFSVWSGSLATAGGVVFYGTLEGYLKAVDAKTGKELYKFKTPSGIIGNVNTWEYAGKQYVGVLSGIGGWAGIGIAAGLDSGEESSNSEGLGAVGAYRSLSSFTKLGGVLTVFALPSN